MTELWAHALTWADVDPLRYPFELDDDAAKELTALVAPLVPDADVAEEERWRSLLAVTDFLVSRYGRWACGWNWSLGEGDFDGGVVEAWCCASHSVTTKEATAPLVVAALLEWRGWLEDLAERFSALTPPEQPGGHGVDAWHWERACTRLVTAVADRTHADSGWYAHCMQVLGWFLAYNGIDEERAREIVKTAVGGRFDSWIAPDVTVVARVSSGFARTIGDGR
ncbi:hypothetical protein [Streptomyces katrae]|uniref:hypothetical protein n=1 Tax=Streptomyces katrae TaxID=68223 RepID=UPI00068BFCD7|nr:hypothetical protein [Streptomyces katrae]